MTTSSVCASVRVPMFVVTTLFYSIYVLWRVHMSHSWASARALLRIVGGLILTVCGRWKIHPRRHTVSNNDIVTSSDCYFFLVGSLLENFKKAYCFHFSGFRINHKHYSYIIVQSSYKRCAALLLQPTPSHLYIIYFTYKFFGAKCGDKNQWQWNRENGYDKQHELSTFYVGGGLCCLYGGN